MEDTSRQSAAAKVVMHFSMSLDGYVAGPEHDMDWMTGFTNRDGLVEEYTSTTGAILGGRDGLGAFPDVGLIYGGGWQGPVFVLTHHPEDLDVDGVTALSCDVAEAVHIAKEAAGDKNVEIFSPSIGRQLLRLGLVDEIDLHVSPILLGAGVKLFDNPDGEPAIRLDLVNGGDPAREVNLRYRPA